MRTFVLAPVLLAVVASGTPSGAERPQTPAAPSPATAFPSTVDVVNVDVIVLDRQGRPVEGLTQADFVVKEDGRPQTLSAFEAVDVAESPSSAPEGQQRISTNTAAPVRGDRSFVIVFDDANLSSYATPRARQVIDDFLARGPRDGDQVTIVPTSGGTWWTGRLPEDRDALVSFVGHLEGAWRPDTSPARIWDHEAIAITNGRDRQLEAEVARRYFENNLIPEAYPQDRELASVLNVSPGVAMIRAKAQQVYREAVTRLRATLSTLARVSASLSQLRGRKTLLLVSEGFIMDPSQNEFRELIQAARDASAAVYFVDVRGPTGSVGQAGMAGGGAEFGRAVEEQDTTTALALASSEGEGARSVAVDTGGDVIQGTNLAEGMAKVVQARAYYVLGYTSNNTSRDGKFRKIQVSVARPDVTVRGRRGYYAPSSEPRPLRKEELDPAVRAGLDSAGGSPGIPLRLTSYVFGPQPDGKRQVLLAAEADVTALHLTPQGGRYAANLDSYVVVYGLDAGTPERQETRLELAMPPEVFHQVERSGVPIRREFRLAPGRYQARLLVKDEATRRLGSVRHEFEVAPIGTLQVTTPILTDSLQAAEAGQRRPIPVAHRTFAAGAPVACAFSILGARPDPTSGAPRVTLAYRLRGAGGNVVMASPARPLTAGPQGQITPIVFLTVPDAPGPYEVGFTIRDEIAGSTLEVNEPFTVVRP
jgi:VWFA-related protein